MTLQEQYAALKREGHSPAKAAEILLDAKRGDAWARDWVKFITERRFGGSR